MCRFAHLFSLLIASFTLACFLSPRAVLANPRDLKVLSFNFNSEMVPVDRSSVLRDRRFAAIQNWIRANDPDIILLQEAWNFHHDPSVALTLARTMGYDVAYRIGMGVRGLLLDSDAVMAKKSLRMKNEVDLKLPHSGPELGDGKTWVIPLGAVSYAVGVELTLPEGEPLLVYSTHLIGMSDASRADQARAIDADARKRGVENVIIGGDFNSEPGAKASAALLGSGYVDTFDLAHPGDRSCSDCADPASPDFNPMTIGAGQFPSQTGETSSERLDYIFSRTPSLSPVSSELVFTAPESGVWMSDHYGLLTIFSQAGASAIPGPTHDSSETLADTVRLTLTDPDFWCGALARDEGCTRELAPIEVKGPRGLTIQNRSHFYFEARLEGPGQILTDRVAGLPSHQQAAFVFLEPGTYHLSIVNTVQSPNPYRAHLHSQVSY